MNRIKKQQCTQYTPTNQPAPTTRKHTNESASSHSMETQTTTITTRNNNKQKTSQNICNSKSPPRQNPCNQKHCQSKTNTTARIHQKKELVHPWTNEEFPDCGHGANIFACMNCLLSPTEQNTSTTDIQKEQCVSKLQNWETIKMHGKCKFHWEVANIHWQQHLWEIWNNSSKNVQKLTPRLASTRKKNLSPHEKTKNPLTARTGQTCWLAETTRLQATFKWCNVFPKCKIGNQ